jgi:hypothetical protein
MVEGAADDVVQAATTNRDRVMFCVVDSGLDIRNPEFDPGKPTGAPAVAYSTAVAAGLSIWSCLVEQQEAQQGS